MTPDALRSPLLSLTHGFFTRQGGVSAGAYASLNTSLSGGDDPAHVLENRNRVAAALGVAPDGLMGVTQVHGARVVALHEDSPLWAAGGGPQADGLVTNQPGLALGIVTADCVPVLLADASAGVVGAAHAGWRGAAAGILENAVDAMRRLGARSERIVAAVGPSIRQASYEVDEAFRQGFLRQAGDSDRFFDHGVADGRWQFDLAGFCAHRLKLLGASVDTIAADTMPDEARFFSHRRRTLAGGGPIGHQMSAITL